MAIMRSMEQRMETVENDFKDMTAAIRSLEGRHEESAQSQRAMFSEMEEFMARFSGESSPPPRATASEMGNTTSPDGATLSAPVQTLPLQKMELPTFDGSDALAWLARAEQYFLVHKTPTAHRLQTAMIAMAGPAMSWFQFLQTRRPHIDWVAFREELLVRFGDDAIGNAYEPLASMQQTGTLADYITTFECHIAPVKGLTAELHCGFFLSGLRPDLRAQIPDDTLHDYTAALKAARRAEHTGSLPVSTNRAPPSPLPPTSAQCLTSPGVSQPPSTPTPSTLATALSSQVSVSPRPFKQMSDAEYQRHRAAGTCFRCGQLK